MRVKYAYCVESLIIWLQMERRCDSDVEAGEV